MTPFDWSHAHIGRSFGDGRDIEQTCPCPIEPCGLVRADRAVDRCTQHGFLKGKTIRQSHAQADCPARPALAVRQLIGSECDGGGCSLTSIALACEEGEWLPVCEAHLEVANDKKLPTFLPLNDADVEAGS